MQFRKKSIQEISKNLNELHEHPVIIFTSNLNNEYTLDILKRSENEDILLSEVIVGNIDRDGNLFGQNIIKI